MGWRETTNKVEELKTLCCQLISCDATQQLDVERAVAQLPQDTVVLSTMGSFRAEVPVDYIGHRYLTNALESKGIRRFLLVTSLRCGDSWVFLSERAKAGFGAAVREKTLAEAWLASSQLDYTILRPGGLKDGAITHSGELSQGIEVHGAITRSEVARLAQQILLSADPIGQIYQCIDPTVSYY
ncbi:hypothetical protein VTH8203_01285 [Vibrio thalassae]|uniref:NAD(P)-binding domain-containing protein n=1 Tax=Vibrio thalassae TaxID=1243014 RepID=A0A240EI99_9VIBR|nr:hypothetical protein VTH8203_01285 [Vibrio thalassae]